MAEKEYIERDELESRIKKYVKCRDADRETLEWAKDECIRQAHCMPAADVVEVRHASWKDNHCTGCGWMPMGEELWDHCDFSPPRFEYFMDFCPSCGAKMDGERKYGAD